MSIRHEKRLRVVLFEGAGTRLDGAARFAAIGALLERGFAVSRTSTPVPDARNETLLLDAEDFAGQDAAQIVEMAELARADKRLSASGAWKPWFPVIDYSRCTNCMQCLSFCLFGVYGVDAEKKIEVQNQDNCKTNCPACSRVCPEAAIMFPKYKSGPINGDEVSAGDLQREKMKIDISSLLGGDVMQMLRDRSDRAKSRFSKERDPDKALKERQKCLIKLQEAGDIPPEVLMALPSPEEIQRRAGEAAARVQAATSNA